MRKLIVFLPFYLYFGFVYPQSVSQDADGFSTIVLPATIFILDVADNEATFNTLSYLPRNKKPLKATESGWLLGGEIKAKAEDGFAQIFSKGDIVSGANANLIFGRKWYRNNDCKILNDLEFIKLQNSKNEMENKIDKGRDSLQRLIKHLLRKELIDSVLYNSIQKYSVNIDTTQIVNKLYKHLDSLKKLILNGQLVDRKIKANAIDKIKATFDDHYIKYLKKCDYLSDKIKIKLSNSKDYFHKVFLRGGINGSVFKYDLSQDSTTVESRFKKKSFEGWNVELAYNVQFKNDHFLGFSYEYRKSNNLGDLDKLDFTLTTKDTSITDGQFTSSTAVKAVSGDYETFDRHSINFDYVWVTPIKKVTDTVSNIFLAVNPYIRHRIYIGSNKLKNNMVLGLALNAFNSKEQKIMVGISVQVNDLFGVHADDNNTLKNRISIGLIAKYTFSGLNAESAKSE